MGHSREKDDKDDKKRKYKDDDERSDRDKRSRYDEKDRRDKDRDSDRKRRDDKDDRSSSRKDEKDRKREKDSKRDEKSSKDEKSSTEKSPPPIVKEVVKELTPEEKAKREQEEKEKQLKEEEMRKRREKWLKAKETILKEQLDAQLQGKQESQNKENIPQPMVIEPPLPELPSVTTPPPTIEEPAEVEIPVIDKEKAAEEARKKIEDANINMRPMDEEKELVKRQTSVTEADSELAEEDGNETITNPTTNSDEVDPLDAFMTGITKEVEELSKKDEEKLKKLTIDQSSIPEYVEEEEEVEPEPVDEEQALLLKIKTKVLPTVDHTQMEYIEFSKSFYNEVPELARMTPEEVLDYREELGITVKGKRCPKPIKFFHQCGLSERILAILNKHGFQKPTPIQAQAIPAIMSGRDVIGCAPTGSGKTLAFLLPMLRHVMAQPPLRPGDGPIALLMAPTRELAVQIFNEVRKFTRILELNVAAVYGGSGMSSQIADLKRGAEIVVCTPGRMIDVLSLNSGKVTNLRRVTYLVLDEADRMFDTGFEHQIMRMVANTRPDRQTVMFSATFPVQMEQVARQARNTKPIEITVGQRSVVNKDVTQLVYVMPPEQKFKKLLEVLKEHASEEANINVLIFVNTQDEGERLNSELMRAGYTALVLHSGKDQEEREFIIDDFKRKIKNIMIATSIASRGLDVEDLRLVVNWDPPNHMEDYVHRSGRTGRAGKKGTAVTLISTDDERYAGSIMRALERSGTPVPDDLKKLVETFNEKKKEGKVQAAGSGYGGKGFQFNEEEARRKMEERKAQKRAAGIEDEEEDDEEVEYDPETDELIVKPKPKPEPTPENSNPNAIPSKEDLNAKIAAIVQKVKASVSGMGDAGVMDELEINDYPQMARWRITRKEALQSITELTGTAITTKGTYYPPGKNPNPGDRKLYLQIEGPDAATVKMARTELLRILSETEFTGAEMSMMGRQGKFKI